MSALSYIWKEYKDAFVSYTICGAFFALMPWSTGPFLLNWLAIILCSYVILTVWCFVVRPIYLSLTRKREK